MSRTKRFIHRSPFCLDVAASLLVHDSSIKYKGVGAAFDITQYNMYWESVEVTLSLYLYCSDYVGV